MSDPALRQLGHLRLIKRGSRVAPASPPIPTAAAMAMTYRITEEEFARRYRMAYNTPGALVVVNMGDPHRNEPAWVMVDDYGMGVLARQPIGDLVYGHLCSDTYSGVGGKRGDVVELTTNGALPAWGRVVVKGFAPD